MSVPLRMKNWSVLFGSFVFVASFFLLPGKNCAISSELFPRPKALEPAINFWIKIYTQYNTNEYVIHDSRNLNIIYEVVKFGSAREAELDLPQTRAERKALKKKRNYYKNILRKLGSSRNKFRNLKGDELKVFELFGKNKNHQVYRTAARNVRTQKGQRNRFLKGLRISGRYLNYIEEIFRRHDLPQELTVMPHVESSFNYRAYSSVGAAGLWQFTRGTGRRFLKINYEIDERLDPIRATEAAAKLLEENYQELGNWPMAITAYNSGTAGMKRAKRILKTSDIAIVIEKYRSRYFKFASRNFYCEFLAALQIVRNYRDYFGDVQFDPPIQFKEFQLPNYVKFATIVDYFNLSSEALKKYNPAFRNSIFNGSKYLPKDYKIKIPGHVQPEVLYAQIPANQLFVAQKRSQWYRVRRGDTLGKIARRNRTSINTLMALNNIRNAHRIRVGEVMRLPDETKLQTVQSAPEPVVANAVSTEKRTKPVEKPKEEIIIADLPTPPKSVESSTKSTLSDAAGPAVADEESSKKSPKPKENPVKNQPKIDLTPANTGFTPSLNPEIELVEGSSPQVGFISVELDETLGHYAEWMGVPTQRIRDWNDLDYGINIRIGQKLRLVFQSITPAEFNENRLEYHRGIEEDFFNNYQVINTVTHKVERGENIWYLCNYVFNLPYWIIRSYNSDLNLESLKPGDLIVVPEIEEISSGN